MAQYRIKWEIDVDAETVRGAAMEALKIQRDKESIATVFDVTSANGKTQRIDLSE